MISGSWREEMKELQTHAGSEPLTQSDRNIHKQLNL